MSFRELLRFRVAALLGKTLREVDELPSGEFDGWARYWSVEPWGPYRDNMHAAMLAVQILKPHVAEGTKIDMENFMFKPPEDPELVKQRNALSFYHSLKAAARKAEPKRFSSQRRK